MLQVNILHDGKLIGRSNLDASDPPMGVASGLFEPGLNYNPNAYAGEIDGVHNPAAANLAYTVQSPDCGIIDCIAVFIQDYNETLNERLVSILGIPYPN